MDAARAIPILPSSNMAQTRDFYCNRLGFQAVGPASDNHLIVRRNEMEIHFWLTEDTELPKVSSCYIRGGEIATLYDEFARSGVPRLSDFSVRPWNMKEFYIHDPHGNLLRFGCIPGEV